MAATPVPANGALAQRMYDSALTMMVEQESIAAKLLGKSDAAVINVEDRQEVSEERGSSLQYFYGDRRRGQAIAPKPMGATGFGQEAAGRPTWTQTMNLQAQELGTCSIDTPEISQQYTNIPLERHEVRSMGAEAAEIQARSLYYHLAGITAYNDASASGGGALWEVPPCGNNVSEMDAAHRFFAAGKTTDGLVAADSSATLSVELLESKISYLQSRANVISPFVPAETPWGNWFLFICDNEGVDQMTRYSSSNRFTSLTLAEIQGGQAVDKIGAFMQANSGFRGTKNILVLIDDYTPFGQSGTTAGLTTAGTQIGNVRRGMLLGRLAMHVKFGAGFDAESSHMRATSHKVYTKTAWKLYTHWGGLPTIPSNHPTPQRLGSATISYYVSSATPTY